MSATPSLKQYRDLEDAYRSVTLKLSRKEEELKQLRAQLEAALAVNDRVEQRIADLEMRVRQDSTTSSQPPSSDKPYTKARKKRERKEKRNKGGKKKGARGHRRSMEAQPDEVKRCAPSCCERCDHSLEEAKERPSGRRQVTELSPLSPKVTEYQRVSKCCRACGHWTRGEYPEEVLRGGCFGPRIRAPMGVMRACYGLSLRKVRLFLREVFGVRVSHGTLSHNEEKLSEFLKENYEGLEKWINKESQLFVDETSWFQSGKLLWLWVKSTGKVRFFRICERRNGATAQAFLEGFKGLLTSDELGSYNVYDEGKRQLCHSHLHRRVLGLGLHPEMKTWSDSVDEELRKMFEVWGQIRDGTQKWESRRSIMREPQEALQELFEVGKEHAHKKVRGLCGRVLKRWLMWWRFVVIGSEPTNNEAERSLRQGVLIRKLTQGSRSDRGSRYMEHSLSMVSTLRGHGQDVFDFFCRTFEQGLRGKPLPQLPLGD